MRTAGSRRGQQRHVRFAALLIGMTIGFAAPTHAADGTSNNTPNNTVVLVLIDGFAPSIVAASDTPNLDRMANEGSFSHHLLPVFPSMSMVNHTSFATGCWPEHHGIMSNIFIDPVRGRYESSPDADWRTGCLSIWEIAEREGLISAALGITGAHSKSKGPTATHTLPDAPWEERLSDAARIDKTIELLAMTGPERPRLIVLYLGGPDEVAHWSGTLSPDTLRAAEAADALVGKLIDAIRAFGEALGEAETASLFIAADHGMIDVSPMINISRIMNRHAIKGEQATDGASAFLYLDDPGDTDRVYERLSAYTEFDTYRRGEHPAWSHLGDGPRTGDLMIVTKPPYWIAGAEGFPLWSKVAGITRLWPDVFVPPMGSGLVATHGFAPSQSEMQTIFYAWGAGIARGHEIEKLNMIDIVPSALHLLGLDSSGNIDGEVLQELFAPEEPPVDKSEG